MSKRLLKELSLIDMEADDLDSASRGNARLYLQDSIKLLSHFPDGGVDLILTDPPYTISRKTGFSSYKKGVARFAISTEFGSWDKEIIDLELISKLFYKILRNGGTAIIFYDLWKISYLQEAMALAGFKMIRVIIWEKTNPVPLNSKRNYLTNCREIAVLGVKGGKPIFNSSYDRGIYSYPIEHRGQRYHPTQKPLQLMSDLILKHSLEGDIILDPFMGSGTTGVSALSLDRSFVGIEKDEEYFKVAKNRIFNKYIK